MLVLTVEILGEVVRVEVELLKLNFGVENGRKMRSQFMDIPISEIYSTIDDQETRRYRKGVESC